MTATATRPSEQQNWYSQCASSTQGYAYQSFEEGQGISVLFWRAPRMLGFSRRNGTLISIQPCRPRKAPGESRHVGTQDLRKQGNESYAMLLFTQPLCFCVSSGWNICQKASKGLKHLAPLSHAELQRLIQRSPRLSPISLSVAQIFLPLSAFLDASINQHFWYYFLKAHSSFVPKVKSF